MSSECGCWGRSLWLDFFLSISHRKEKKNSRPLLIGTDWPLEERIKLSSVIQCRGLSKPLFDLPSTFPLLRNRTRTWQLLLLSLLNKASYLAGRILRDLCPCMQNRKIVKFIRPTLCPSTLDGMMNSDHWKQYSSYVAVQLQLRRYASEYLRWFARLLIRPYENI